MWFLLVSFSEQLDSAAEHIQNFLEAKDKEVVGTTFQSLNAMCRQITECRYFDSDHSDAAEAEDEGAEEEPEAEAMQTTPVNGTIHCQGACFTKHT